MEEAGIYLFTSDRQEGWGAVLNEAMNSGCSVVASHAAGSAPYLIHDGENGLLYTSGNVDEMYEKVKRLLDSPEDQRRIGSAAYTTMRDTWNAEIAVDRILLLTERILAGEKHPNLFEKGPGSIAKKKNK
jgi:glycosyltransferase involved in cell wall biosynthesis